MNEKTERNQNNDDKALKTALKRSFANLSPFEQAMLFNMFSENNDKAKKDGDDTSFSGDSHSGNTENPSYEACGERKVRVFDPKKSSFNSSLTTGNRNTSTIRRQELIQKLPEFAYLPKSTLRDYLSEAEQTYKDGIVGLEPVCKKLLLHLVKYHAAGHTRPLLFVGEPGSGKTCTARIYAKMLGVKSYLLNAPRAASSRGLSGDSGSYSDADCGAVAEAMVTTGKGNPLIIIDEIDKACHPGSRGLVNLQDELLGLLDESAADFYDNFLQVSFNASYCPIVLTANEIDDISAPLADRCEIIRFPEMTLEHLTNVVSESCIPRLLEEYGCGGRVESDSVLVEKFIADKFDEGVKSIRVFHTIFDDAVGSAYLRSVIDGTSTHLTVEDLGAAAETMLTQNKRRIGF